MTTRGYVLLSGGIDSTTAMAVAVRDLGQRNVQAISIDYGQRHKREIEHAARVANYWGRPHNVIELPNIVPRTMLTDPTQPIPDVSYAELPVGVSPSYVPFRNGLMLSALTSYIVGNLADGDEALLFFGAHADDSANYAYADCFPEFTGAMACAIFIGTYQKVRLQIPFQFMSKTAIIELGTKLDVPYHLTFSCYKGGDLHCGTCPTCRARKEAFVLAGVADPTEYVA